MKKFLYFIIFTFGLLIAQNAFASIILRPVFHTGLVGYWSFQEGAGNNVYDKSGKGNTGTWNGTGTSHWADGKIGKGGSFNGTDDYVALSNSSDYKPTSRVTISAWFKADDWDSSFVITGISVANMHFYIAEGGGYEHPTIYLTFAGAGAQMAQWANQSLNVGQWYHIAGVYDGNDLILYFDGVARKVTNIGVDTISQPASTMLIGRLGADYSNGLIDEVRIYNRALDESEISRLYKLSQPKISTVAMNNGLVGYWDFQEGAGNNVYDKSGYDNDGIWNGTGSHWADGKIGKGGSFNGTDDYVYVTEPTGELNLVNNFTLSAWIKPEDSSGTRAIVGRYYQYVLWIENDNTLSAIIRNSSGDYEYPTSGTAVTEGVWSHVAITFSDSVVTFYINGVKIITDSIATSQIFSDTNYYMHFGIYSSLVSLRFPGIIDEIRAYNRVLSEGEMSRLYKLSQPKINASQNNQLTNGLVGLWSFNGSDIDGNEAYDRSGQGNTGTIVGATKTIGKVGQAMEFNGTSDYIAITDDSIFDLNASNSYSWSFWIKPQNLTNPNTIWSQDLGIDDDTYVLIYAGSFDVERWGPVTNGIGAGWVNQGSSGGEQLIVETNNNVLTLNTWHHVVITYTYSTNALTRFKIYVDGADKTTGAEQGGTSIENISPAYTRIGSNQQYGEYFDGMIDEARFYNRALTAQEVLRLYNMGH
ncbi:MAG: hypothetical protein A2V69_00620 [Candidatus Portnoybacteria bacterium RBG_13_40_8]|uniref:LamG-like jellyroll fold domain-containing protein n=1 Tax=Candidatus Portnoybacteria bacterium RBG_13_40_8 TaxID=1801990 RepID=A0A1G2F457_9BACT|nr:MAG: hypothetical protein A2V69_00620 [Candidatus Portnoybacteria bacterium RBG_13_40_8]